MQYFIGNYRQTGLFWVDPPPKYPDGFRLSSVALPNRVHFVCGPGTRLKFAYVQRDGKPNQMRCHREGEISQSVRVH